MSGGIAFVLDLDLNYVNTQTVIVEPLTEEDERGTLLHLLEEHYERTNSLV